MFTREQKCLTPRSGILNDTEMRHAVANTLQPSQVLALEKLLLVTSTVPHAAAPPPRPPLASLPPVNEAVTPPQRAPGSAGSRIPETPADGSHDHSPGPDGAGAALGNGAVAERGGLGLGLGFGIAGAALAASPPAAAHGSEVRPSGWTLVCVFLVIKHFSQTTSVGLRLWRRQIPAHAVDIALSVCLPTRLSKKERISNNK